MSTAILSAYLDERTEEGKEIVKLLDGFEFYIIPMSGVPEVICGLARYVGVEDIKTFLGEYK